MLFDSELKSFSSAWTPISSAVSFIFPWMLNSRRSYKHVYFNVLKSAKMSFGHFFFSQASPINILNVHYRVFYLSKSRIWIENLYIHIAITFGEVFFHFFRKISFFFGFSAFHMFRRIVYSVASPESSIFFCRNETCGLHFINHILRRHPGRFFFNRIECFAVVWIVVVWKLGFKCDALLFLFVLSFISMKFFDFWPASRDFFCQNLAYALYWSNFRRNSCILLDWRVTERGWIFPSVDWRKRCLPDVFSGLLAMSTLF